MIFRKVNFYILTDHEIISTQSAHILDNYCFDKAISDVIHHTLKIWSVEICTCISVIRIIGKIRKAIGFRIIFKQCFLMFNASAFRVNTVIKRKSGI
jgi:hypothetical protein